MVSRRLDQQEQELVRAICSELDGVPYAEKARLIRASLDSSRAGDGRQCHAPRRRANDLRTRRLVRIA